MGSTMDFLGATIADALSPRFRRPVEDIIYETIDRKQIPTRTDFTELRNTIGSLRSQSTGAQKGIEKLKAGLDDVEEAIHDLNTQIVDLQSLVQQLQAANDALQSQLTATSGHGHGQEESQGKSQSSSEAQIDSDTLAAILTRLEALEAEPKATVNKTASKPSASCKVDGCSSKVRAGGFCSRHYNKWRRGTLDGFVSYESTVVIGDKVVSVDESLKGLAYTVDNGTLSVDGKEVEI